MGSPPQRVGSEARQGKVSAAVRRSGEHENYLSNLLETTDLKTPASTIKAH